MLADEYSILNRVYGSADFIVQAFHGGGIGVGIWGALTIALSILILSSPLAGVVVLPFVFGITALVGGIMTIAGAFIAKK